MSKKQTIIADLLDGVHPRVCAKRHEITLHYIKLVAKECGIALPKDITSSSAPGRLTQIQRDNLKVDIESGLHTGVSLAVKYDISNAMISIYTKRWRPNGRTKPRRPSIADESASGSEVKGAQAS